MAADRRLRWLFPVLALLALVFAWLYWPSHQRDLPAVPSMSGSEIVAMSDSARVGKVAGQLRWYLAADDRRQKQWRTLAEPARHLLVLSAVEGDQGAAASSDFHGFNAQAADTQVLRFTSQELADAYRAIGAKACAAVADEAGKAAGDAKRLADCDRRLIAASSQDKAIALLAAYIRQHADELAAVWAKP
jgi:hypothetical protein